MTDKQEYVTANLSQKILWQLIGRKIMWETGKKALKANQTLFPLLMVVWVDSTGYGGGIFAFFTSNTVSRLFHTFYLSNTLSCIFHTLCS